MKEKMNNKITSLKEYWVAKSSNQKIMIAGSIITFFILIGGIIYFASHTPLVPLYSNLKPSETGSIKESLDEKGIKSEITDGGSTIKVPKDKVETLMVELAAEGIPKSGNIDYSFFGNNAGFGMTDNEFNVLKLDATQTELAELIKTIDGVNDASVMINMPEKAIFANEVNEEASASIILQTKSGQEFDEKQIKSLYYLVSKSIPNLPVDNIVIRNQYLEYFDLNDQSYADSGITQQIKIKNEIEKDIQRRVQSMLGTLIGFDKVITSVTADIDFTQEKREENLVAPVNEEDSEGLAISAHRITETYSGNSPEAGGIPEGADSTDAGGTQYLEGTNQNGDYEKTEETINNEINRIKKDIVESPYKIRDLGIQVMVEPPNPEDLTSLPEERVTDIQQILSSIVRTSIDKEIGDITDEAIQNKVSVSVQPFNGKATMADAESPTISWWIYLVGGLLVATIVLLIILLIRNKKKAAEEIVLNADEEEDLLRTVEIPELQEETLTESAVRRKQLEKLAKEKPDEFAKLLRTWLAED